MIFVMHNPNIILNLIIYFQIYPWTEIRKFSNILIFEFNQNIKKKEKKIIVGNRHCLRRNDNNRWTVLIATHPKWSNSKCFAQQNDDFTRCKWEVVATHAPPKFGGRQNAGEANWDAAIHSYDRLANDDQCSCNCAPCQLLFDDWMTVSHTLQETCAPLSPIQCRWNEPRWVDH